MIRTVLLLALVAFGGSIGLSHAARANKLLVVSFDGFRRDYLDRGLTPNFAKLIRQGVTSKKVVPVFPTFTQPAHYSIVTGRHPDHHGVVANTFYEPGIGRGLGFYFEGYNLHPDFWNYNKTEPIWISASKQGKRASAYLWSGSEVKFPDENGKEWEIDYSLSKLFDSNMTWPLVVNNAISGLQSGRDAAFIHWSYPDKTGHEYGPDSFELNQTLIDVDEKLGFLREQIDIYGFTNQLNLLIVSDHGMTHIKKVVNVGVDYNISQTEYLPFTWGGFMFMDPSARGDVNVLYDKLKKGQDYFDVYHKDQVPSRLVYGKNPRVSKLVLIGRNGALLRPGGDLPFLEGVIEKVMGEVCATQNKTVELPIVPQLGIVPINITLNLTGPCESNISLSSVLHSHGQFYVGNHGFDNIEPEMEPMFAAVGPEFKAGAVMESVGQVDYYSLMAALMHIKAQPHDGNFDVFKSVLVDPNAYDGSDASCRQPVLATVLAFMLLSFWLRA